MLAKTDYPSIYNGVVNLCWLFLTRVQISEYGKDSVFVLQNKYIREKQVKSLQITFCTFQYLLLHRFKGDPQFYFSQRRMKYKNK